MEVIKMNKEYMKTILIKAGWAAVYGALAELSVTQSFSKETLWIALGVAISRGAISFFTTIKDELKKNTKKSFQFDKKSWKQLL
jgi:hypothetical protein